YGFHVAYTLSATERDTEDSQFLPQDQRNYAAEYGPANLDTRHQLAASGMLELPGRFELASVVLAHSALPYNETTGNDDNRDTIFNDRPPGVSRNSRRGDDFWQIDVRASKGFSKGAARIDLMAEAFNVANHRNWTKFEGLRLSPAFGRPT